MTEQSTAELQVAAIEALIAPDSGLGYTLVPGLRAFREKQIREALDHPAARLSASEPLAGVPGAGSPQNRSQGRDLTGGDDDA